jgi:hypothetical protein
MPGVQFPFSTLSEDDRLSGISAQIGEALMFAFCPSKSLPTSGTLFRISFCACSCLLLMSLCHDQQRRVRASHACSRLAVLICFFAKVESRAHFRRRCSLFSHDSDAATLISCWLRRCTCYSIASARLPLSLFLACLLSIAT